jgi:hypothetical protein
MLTPKDLGIIIVMVTCIISLKCKIIFNITSTYITFVIYGNVGFLAGTIVLEVAYSMTTVALNIGGATGDFLLVVSSVKHEVRVVVSSMSKAHVKSKVSSKNEL